MFIKPVQEFDYRFGLFAIATGLVATYLFIVDMFDTPLVFENLRYELAFAAPFIAWLICRRAFHWTDPRR